MENKVIVGSLNPCFTHYLPEVERYEDLAKEVRLNLPLINKSIKICFEGDAYFKIRGYLGHKELVMVIEFSQIISFKPIK